MQQSDSPGNYNSASPDLNISQNITSRRGRQSYHDMVSSPINWSNISKEDDTGVYCLDCTSPIQNEIDLTKTDASVMNSYEESCRCSHVTTDMSTFMTSTSFPDDASLLIQLQALNIEYLSHGDNEFYHTYLDVKVGKSTHLEDEEVCSYNNYIYRSHKAVKSGKWKKVATNLMSALEIYDGDERLHKKLFLLQQYLLEFSSK